MISPDFTAIDHTIGETQLRWIELPCTQLTQTLYICIVDLQVNRRHRAEGCALYHLRSDRCGLRSLWRWEGGRLTIRPTTIRATFGLALSNGLSYNYFFSPRGAWISTQHGGFTDIEAHRQNPRDANALRPCSPSHDHPWHWNDSIDHMLWYSRKGRTEHTYTANSEGAHYCCLF